MPAPKKKTSSPRKRPGKKAAAPARGKDLFIVESPGKIKALKRILGDSYTIKASMGHVMDLPKVRMGVDIEDGFKPELKVIAAKRSLVKELKRAAEKSGRVYLAPDPDREGEAIAWHLFQILGLDGDRVRRVVYQEITPEAVREALNRGGEIDTGKVDAQEARRVLDRIVGYRLSPLLWKKVGRGLSAGRVQSVALLLICRREEEIEAFVPEEYWEFLAHLEKTDGKGGLTAKLEKIDGKKAKIPDRAAAEKAEAELKTAEFRVAGVKTRTSSRAAPPPFITSRLQTEAARSFRWTVARTMKVAQRLYEGVELGGRGAVGLITYMRTDSYHLAAGAVDKIRRHIENAIGPEYLPDRPRRFRAKKSQEGHEAIRPTDVELTPEKVRGHLTDEQFQLYSLIWKRAVASQMMPARIASVTVEITAAGRYGFVARREKVVFPGYLKVYRDEKDEAENGGEFPSLRAGEILNLLKLEVEQRFTKPPGRYTEGTLVRALEGSGVGRPSTYVPILATLRRRDYIRSEKGRLFPTLLGRTVNRLLQDHFSGLINVNFTAALEKDLDGIEAGRAAREKVLAEFYGSFERTLSRAEKKMENLKKILIPTKLKCTRCGGPMVIRWGRRGEFLACSRYPDCRNTGAFRRREDGTVEAVKEKVREEKCPDCGRSMVEKRGRFGTFLACSGYPECKRTMAMPTGFNCPAPDCGGELVARRSRRGRTFYGCSRYPECRQVSWKLPRDQKTPTPPADGDGS